MLSTHKVKKAKSMNNDAAGQNRTEQTSIQQKSGPQLHTWSSKQKRKATAEDINDVIENAWIDI